MKRYHSAYIEFKACKSIGTRKNYTENAETRCTRCIHTDEHDRNTWLVRSLSSISSGEYFSRSKVEVIGRYHRIIVQNSTSHSIFDVGTFNSELENSCEMLKSFGGGINIKFETHETSTLVDVLGQSYGSLEMNCDSIVLVNPEGFKGVELEVPNCFELEQSRSQDSKFAWESIPEPHLYTLLTLQAEETSLKEVAELEQSIRAHCAGNKLLEKVCCAPPAARNEYISGRSAALVLQDMRMLHIQNNIARNLQWQCSSRSKRREGFYLTKFIYTFLNLVCC